jgi:putative colanic acid biosynthesis glycosyltransferase
VAPFFSIVTIARNDVAGLQATCASVQAQSFEDFAWIVVDGDSTDGSVDFLRRLEQPWVSWRSEPDGGIYDAMNSGLAQATGDYVWFMNAGDTFAGPDSLALVAAAAQQHASAGLLYGDALELPATGPLRSRPTRDVTALWRGMFTHHQAMVFRREAVGELRYDTSYRLSADYAFVAELVAKQRVSTRRIEEDPLCIYQLGGASEKQRRAAIREDARVRRELLGLGRAQVTALSLAHHLHHTLKSVLPLVTSRRRSKVQR